VKSDLNEASLNRLGVEGDAVVFTAEQWKAMAEKHDLTGETTPLISELEARQLSEEPGFFHADVTDMAGRGEEARRVGLVAFASAGVYTPTEAIEIPKTFPRRPTSAARVPVKPSITCIGKLST
jgi:hypothetical protein